MISDLKVSKKIHYTLRIAVAMCFIGHGAFGIITKPIWCNYFGVFGIGTHHSYQLMPVVGAVDILLGLIVLIYPFKAVPLWLVIWGFITALLRPLSGEPIAEFIERAGNFGAPLALLILSGFPKNIKEVFSVVKPDVRSGPKTLIQVSVCLRIVAFLLLIGHGWLNFIGKQAIINQYSALGFSHPENIAQIIGIAEIISAFIILIKPFRELVFILLIWKMTIEMLYPNYSVFEWIERGGSYGVLLALWMLTEKKFTSKFIGSLNFLFGDVST